MATKIDPYQPGRSSRFYAGAMNLMQTGAEMQSAAIAGRYQAASAAIGAIGSSVTAALQANTQMKLGMLKLHHDSSIERAKLDVTMAELDMKREAAGLMASESKLRLQEMGQRVEQAEMGLAQSQATHEGNILAAADLPGLTTRVQNLLTSGRPPTLAEEAEIRAGLTALRSRTVKVRRGEQDFELIAPLSGPMDQAASQLLEQVNGMTKTQIGDRVYSTAELQEALAGSPYEASQIIRLGAGKPNLRANAQAVLDRTGADAAPYAVRAQLEYFLVTGKPPLIDANTDPGSMQSLLRRMSSETEKMRNLGDIGMSEDSPVAAALEEAGVSPPPRDPTSDDAGAVDRLLTKAAGGNARTLVFLRHAVANVDTRKPEDVAAVLGPYSAHLTEANGGYTPESLAAAVSGVLSGAPPKETRRTAVDSLLGPVEGLSGVASVTGAEALYRAWGEGADIGIFASPEGAALMGRPGSGAAGAARASVLSPIAGAVGRWWHTPQAGGRAGAVQTSLNELYKEAAVAAAENPPNSARVVQLYKLATGALSRAQKDSRFAEEGISVESILTSNAAMGVSVIHQKVTKPRDVYAQSADAALAALRTEVLGQAAPVRSAGTTMESGAAAPTPGDRPPM
jgi:hypothetical protein